MKGIILLKKYLEQSDSKNLAVIVLTYILETGEVSDKKAFFDLINSELPPHIGDEMTTIAEQLKADGVQQGIQQERERIALHLLAKNEDPANIAELTDLSLKKIKELKRKPIGKPYRENKITFI